mmetsp:Transcript_110673/g.207395  ORF Transcript_110673/g.207395 Transcript_110673/m.207395 type:complete len:344 (-) Transcript_110673:571-1602(-)
MPWSKSLRYLQRRLQERVCTLQLLPPWPLFPVGTHCIEVGPLCRRKCALHKQNTATSLLHFDGAPPGNLNTLMHQHCLCNCLPGMPYTPLHLPLRKIRDCKPHNLHCVSCCCNDRHCRKYKSTCRVRRQRSRPRKQSTPMPQIGWRSCRRSIMNNLWRQSQRNALEYNLSTPRNHCGWHDDQRHMRHIPTTQQNQQSCLQHIENIPLHQHQRNARVNNLSTLWNHRYLHDGRQRMTYIRMTQQTQQNCLQHIQNISLHQHQRNARVSNLSTRWNHRDWHDDQRRKRHIRTTQLIQRNCLQHILSIPLLQLLRIALPSILNMPRNHFDWHESPHCKRYTRIHQS